MGDMRTWKIMFHNPGKMGVTRQRGFREALCDSKGCGRCSGMLRSHEIAQPTLGRALTIRLGKVDWRICSWFVVWMDLVVTATRSTTLMQMEVGGLSPAPSIRASHWLCLPGRKGLTCVFPGCLELLRVSTGKQSLICLTQEVKGQDVNGIRVSHSL